MINPGDGDAGVTISALDDSGTSASGGDVTLTLPSGQALALTAQQLETGESGFTGNGNWQLLVSADRSIVVMNLMARHWTLGESVGPDCLVTLPRCSMHGQYRGRTAEQRFSTGVQLRNRPLAVPGRLVPASLGLHICWTFQRGRGHRHLHGKLYLRERERIREGWSSTTMTAIVVHRSSLSDQPPREPAATPAMTENREHQAGIW